MIMKVEKQAPYCPPGTLLMVLRYYRRQDVPSTLAKEKLIQLGVTEALLARTWQGLVFLGLIDNKTGKTTETLESIRFATDETYPSVLTGILQKAYADIFSVIGDPATANDVKIRNAFTPYKPGGQRDRMAILFVGLSQEAGIPLAVSVNKRRTQSDSSIPRSPRPVVAPQTTPRQRGARVPFAVRRARLPVGDDAPLVAMFNARPEVGTEWAQKDRQRWADAMLGIVNFIYIDPEAQADFQKIVDDVDDAQGDEQGDE